MSGRSHFTAKASSITGKCFDFPVCAVVKLTVKGGAETTGLAWRLMMEERGEPLTEEGATSKRRGAHRRAQATLCVCVKCFKRSVLDH